jgi:hypothetical protein
MFPFKSDAMKLNYFTVAFFKLCCETGCDGAENASKGQFREKKCASLIFFCINQPRLGT